MALRKVRLELARTAEFPEGTAQRGYEFLAPLTDDGHLDETKWRTQRDACTVHRFWAGEEDEYGHLVHHGGRRWAFRHGDASTNEEEPIFRFDRHTFAVSEYVSITEHDGVQRTFRVGRGSPGAVIAGARIPAGANSRRAAAMTVRAILVPLFGGTTDAAGLRPRRGWPVASAPTSTPCSCASTRPTSFPSSARACRRRSSTS